MTVHNWRLDVGSGWTAITCTCGQFTKKATAGNRAVREEHLKYEHQQHVEEAELEQLQQECGHEDAITIQRDTPPNAPPPAFIQCPRCKKRLEQP